MFRIAYTDEALAERRTIPAERRKPFEEGMREIGRFPYDSGSSAVKGNRDRREATVSGLAVIRYEVSPSVLIVTVLRLVPLP
ncbi:hypothetical protein [Streptomyces aidingensis]|uniref:mRNA interferase RelE/StbE n=1 Tax=Streptomyces aidingensis TaxID=910347 RepID=A0A1I1HYU5_9ACTN|nr:hypothetical protein [Streptomyces aidingensis]SFC26623.1 hypothetical protein SAMN05421773_102497 [Streptomyces aidingensis]